MAEMITVQHEQPVQAYLARPQGEIRGAVVVIHEVWGLVDHIKAVADRLAAEGYIALAPDLLDNTALDMESIGKLQEGLFDPERRNAVQPELRRLMTPMQNPEFGAQVSSRVQACFDYLYELADSWQKVAVMGFCFGGTYSYSLAVREHRLIAAIPYYGHADQDVAMLQHIACPVLAFYGEQDQGLVDGLDSLKQRMQEANVTYTAIVYPGCGHAFFNDTNRFAYNQAAADDAWQRSLELLRTVTE